MAKRKNDVRYRVVGGKHHMVVDGVMTSLKPGDDIYLDPKQVPAGLRDRLIPVEAPKEPEAPVVEEPPVEEVPVEEPPVEEEPPATKPKGKKKGGK